MSQLLEQIPSGALLRPVASVADILRSQEEATQLITQVLKEGVDYGKIPGTGDKDTLLKPGAERLNKAFGCAVDFSVVEREADHFVEVPWSKRKKAWHNKFKGDKSFDWVEEVGTSLGLYRYVVKCSLVFRQTGEIVGTGVGVCSSLESKYADRPRDCENTILKMAEKRAMVAATLIAYGLSDRFTQDVEDIQANKRAYEPQEVIEAQFTEHPAQPEPPAVLNYLTLDREVHRVEHDAAMALVKRLFSKEQYAELKAASAKVGLDDRFVVLEGNRLGLDSAEKIIALVNPDPKATPPKTTSGTTSTSTATNDAMFPAPQETDSFDE